jgi:NitT/TauT family transport system permease protein
MSNTNFKNIVTPNERVSNNTARWILAGWVIIWVAYWTFFKPTIFPAPLEVLSQIPDQWMQEGLGQELTASFIVNVQALFFSTIISLPLAYLCLTPLFRPLALGISKLRFLSPGIFFLLLLFATSSGHQLKVAMLTLGETFFLTTSMVGAVQAISNDEYDYARTLRMGEWTVLWYTVIRGTLPQALDAIRDNAAMGWSMLTMVEGFIRSEGGIGVVIQKHEAHSDFSVVYAVAVVVLITGLLQDEALIWIRNTVCPYAERTR